MTLQLSQIFLIGALLFFLVYVFRLRTVLSDRIIYSLLACGGAIFIFYPDWSTQIANYIGVGRGVDLILYIFVVFLLFHHVNIAARFKHIEHQMTLIVRGLALADARRDLPAPAARVDKDSPPTEPG